MVPIRFLPPVGRVTTQEHYSELWGKQGERWDPLGRLPEASYADGVKAGGQLDRPVDRELAG